MADVKLFEVGGCVRDELLGLSSKDVDFVVEADSFEMMEEHLEGLGLKIFLSKPEFSTIRCGVPKGHPLRERCKDADFVLARKDGPSMDGRRPQFVERGTLADDLARRDFTINALARNPRTGALIDHHGGLEDLENRLLRFVGVAEERIREDGLRVLRGFRFMVTKGLTAEAATDTALRSSLAVEMLSCVSLERVREELEKMFVHDTLASLRLLSSLSQEMQEAIFRGNLRLSATMKK
jgi:tRNA nucleotidyltransferase (CCA-adding enzyme)